MFLQGNITDSDDDEPSEVSKLTHSELLIYFHEVNGCYEWLREKYAKLESQKDTLIECNEQLDQLVKNYQRRIPKCDKCPTFEEEIKKSEINIKSLENEILILKENENTRRENSIKKCTQLLNENESLKTQVQQLSTTLDKFSKSEISLNMLLGEQSVNTVRQGLGYKSKNVRNKINQVNSMCTSCRKFGHDQNNCWYRPKHVKTISIWVPKGTNIKSLKVKQIWMPKGTYINSFGSPQNYFSKYYATNNHGPIKTNRSHKSFIV